MYTVAVVLKRRTYDVAQEWKEEKVTSAESSRKTVAGWKTYSKLHLLIINMPLESIPPITLRWKNIRNFVEWPYRSQMLCSTRRYIRIVCGFGTIYMDCGYLLVLGLYFCIFCCELRNKVFDMIDVKIFHIN